jgi:phytoene desaturase
VSRVAVIGGGIAGLSAAGELAAKGHRVELFERAATLGGKAQVVSAAGVVLDTGPTLLTMPQTVRDTFARLEASDLLPTFHRLELQSQYHWPDGQRFDCWEDLGRAQDSARQIDAHDGDALGPFFAEAEAIYRAAGLPYLEAPFQSLPRFLLQVLKHGAGSVISGLKLSTLDALARKHFKSEPLRNFVGRFATYTGASPYSSSAAFAMIPHIERAFGVHHVEGGLGALVGALGKALARLGVTVHTGVNASWGSAPRGFLAGPEGDRRPFDSVILNADPMSQVGRAGEPMSMSGYVFLLAVKRRLSIPHHAVIFSRDYAQEFAQLFSGQVPVDPTVYVCHPAANDETMAAEGRSGLFVMVNAPAFADRASAERDWPEAAQRLRALCLKKLEQHFPDFSGAPFELIGQRTPLDLERTGAPGGSIYGYLPHGKFGPFRRPPLASGVPGVFFAGGGTHPGGGVPLVMLSGHFAAGLVTRHLGGRA